MSYNDLRNARVSMAGPIYFVTCVTQWRHPEFTDFKAARMLANALRESDREGDSHTVAWVVMPDHFHWLFALQGKAELSRVVGQVKGQSAHRINRYQQREGIFWQKSFHDHALRADENINNVSRYIVANPLRSGLVQRIEDYPHWDAVWLTGDDSQ